MRHDPAGAAIVVMLRGLKMFGMAQAAGELMEQGAPAFNSAVPILSASCSRRKPPSARSIGCLPAEGGALPVYKDLSGFDFASSETNEALVRQLYGVSSSKTPTTWSSSAVRAPANPHGHGAWRAGG